MCALTPESRPAEPGPLVVATCQFPVSADVARNGRFILRQLGQAAARGAHVAHFPEGSLSGYAGTDFTTFGDFDWRSLESTTRQVSARAADLGMWAVIGSAHRLSDGQKPHNCLYIVDDTGRLVDRYDKRFCAGDPSGHTSDLAHYTPGNHECCFVIRGVRCGAAICHDYRYPELYRQLKRGGVQLVFHSYHAGNIAPERWAAMRNQTVGDRYARLNPAGTYPGITMPATMTAAAAANHVWISCPNSSARESCFGSFFVRADGITTGRLPRNRTGILLSTVDVTQPLYDSTAAWRDRAIAGVLHSGTPADDPRSADRTSL
jgi:predicted amidohydrolase